MHIFNHQNVVKISQYGRKTLSVGHVFFKISLEEDAEFHAQVTTSCNRSTRNHNYVNTLN